jgi:ribosomal protein L24E
MGGKVLGAPVVGMSGTPDGNGYREVASDGGIFAFGDAGFEGSMGAHFLDAPVVGMAATPDGLGYWEVASDGGIFAFGNAAFEGSMGGQRLNAPVLGMASTPDGKGYWEVASDGGIFSFGDATFEGSMGGQPLKAPVVGIAAAPEGKGYWEVASDGGVFAFGDAAFEGSEGGQHLNAPVVGMAATPHGKGYWEVASDGGSFPFGDAAPVGSPPSVPPRVAFYGDSLGMEAAQDFIGDVQGAGGTAFVRTYVSAPCDWLPEMPGDVASFQPTAVVLEFAGDNFTPCMSGYQLGSPQYYAKYQADTQSAINVLRAAGSVVYLVGIPYDNNTSLNPNVANLNEIYASLAAANTGVNYVDAGQAVMLNGAFTWTLPCLPGEPCTGPSGTNVVRGPDGSHFCPSGSDTINGYFAECTVYSSGALRFAGAMLKPVLAGD